MIQKIDKIHHIRPGYRIRICLQPCERRLNGDYSFSPGKEYSIISTPGSKCKRNGSGGVWIQGRYIKLFIYFFEYFPVKSELKRIIKIKRSFSFTRSK